MTAYQARFEKFVARQEHGCWEWTGARNDDGYGRFFLSGNKHAHRVAYELAVGPIAPGLVIDHLCRNRCCVNPEHMEPVTRAENNRRGDRYAMGSWERSVTHCPSGHEYTPENTRVHLSRGSFCRLCRTCERVRNKRRHRSAN